MKRFAAGKINFRILFFVLRRREQDLFVRIAVHKVVADGTGESALWCDVCRRIPALRGSSVASCVMLDSVEEDDVKVCATILSASPVKF